MDEFAIADVLNVETIDGEARATLGNAVERIGTAADAPFYTSGFLIGVPALPLDNGDSAQAAYVVDGEDPTIIGVRDNRWVDKVGELKFGSWAIVTDSDAVIKCDHERDMVVIQTTNKQTGYTMQVLIDGESGLIQTRNGAAITTNDGTSITMQAGGGTSNLSITPTEIRMTAPTIYVTGGFTSIGDQGNGTPPPPGPANAAAVSPVPGVVSTKVSIAI